MNEIDTAVRWLEDEAAIRGLIARFAQAANMNDIAAFRTVWATDGEWSIDQPINTHASGIDDMALMLTKLLDGRKFFIHYAIPGPIAIDGDKAQVTCVCSESAQGPGETYYRNHAYYFDRLRRTPDGWRFAKREYVYVWIDTSPFAGDSMSLPQRPNS